jgi:hypothetical protein
MTAEEKNESRKETNETGTDSGEDYRDWNESTSRSAWERIRTQGRIFLGQAMEVADGFAQRGRSEVEIAQLKLRLKNTYAQLGELVFRLKEGEDNDRPLTDPEVQDLFDQIRSLLGEIEAEREHVREMKRKDFHGA